MKKLSKEERKQLENLQKLMETPWERGFSCCEATNCELCIKASSYNNSTTPCEDELEDDKYHLKTDILSNKAEYGIYSSPHTYEVASDWVKAIKEHNIKLYRAWLRTAEGGVLGIPYPSYNREIAIDSAKVIAIALGGHFIDIEELGDLELKP